MSLDYVFTIDLERLAPEELAVLGSIGGTVQLNAGQLDDEAYTRLVWLLKHRQPLDLERPRTFSEKIQWLKLRAQSPRMPPLVDKLAARDYVAQRGYEEILNELHFAGESLDGVDPATLPARFMVKCNHGCGWNIAVTDPDAAEWTRVTERVRYWLSLNYYELWREWVYRDIPPRVFVESLLEDPGPRGLLDYKVLCFNGRARYVQVDFDRATAHTRSIYDTEWNRLPCAIHFPPAPFEVPAPPNLDRMLSFAEALAGDFPFIRVDMFNVAGRIVFGEFTFFPGNGLIAFTPPEYDRMFGEQLALQCDR